MDRNVWTTACSTNGCVEVQWLTACASTNNCVEVAWMGACSNGGCVEVSHEPDRVLVRDGKLKDKSPVIVYTLAEWNAILADSYTGPPFPIARTLYGGGYAWVGPNEGQTGLVTLEFDGDEISEFLAGVKAGTFKVTA